DSTPEVRARTGIRAIPAARSRQSRRFRLHAESEGSDIDDRTQLQQGGRQHAIAGRLHGRQDPHEQPSNVTGAGSETGPSALPGGRAGAREESMSAVGPALAATRGLPSTPTSSVGRA